MTRNAGFSGCDVARDESRWMLMLMCFCVMCLESLEGSWESRIQCFPVVAHGFKMLFWCSIFNGSRKILNEGLLLFDLMFCEHLKKILFTFELIKSSFDLERTFNYPYYYFQSACQRAILIVRFN